ncbi:hypothetical protein F4W09_16025 [Acinetobacter tandoii]|uniref:Uncharacterized protein n=1 Tax=Acinetobacter tandoii TaxID=202954 RepID=A0A5N4W5W5_9GAMM|nr:hypothetical protein F4W09_16025 [Acinetobacter tandoii]
MIKILKTQISTGLSLVFIY